jgi:hypothetical protein
MILGRYLFWRRLALIISNLHLLRNRREVEHNGLLLMHHLVLPDLC